MRSIGRNSPGRPPVLQQHPSRSLGLIHADEGGIHFSRRAAREIVTTGDSKNRQVCQHFLHIVHQKRRFTSLLDKRVCAF